jgi:MFS family permease
MNENHAMPAKRWINRTVWAIVLATFFSDVSHEMATAVLPNFIQSVGMGAMALGLIEGLADFLVSLSKLGGGVLGHHVRHKKPWAALGYVITSACTSAIGLTQTLWAMVTLRTIAWAGRGYRSPLRDYLLADAVEKTHYGRAYGLERAGDMLGAVVGPLLAALMVWLHVPLSTIILWGIIPGLLAASSMFFLAREREDGAAAESSKLGDEKNTESVQKPNAKFPTMFWLMLVGVMLFGLGDFSRTFLILLAAAAIGHEHSMAASASAGEAIGAAVTISFVPMLLYAMHNAVSAAAAYPAGHVGDRRAKLPVLVAGYALGVVTNVLLAIDSGSIGWLAVVFVFSGIYYAIEETLEKAVVADLIPRDLRSLGLGYLACGNAVGDMASSLYVGALLHAKRPEWAFGIAAGLGAVGVGWMLFVLPRAEKGVARR